jgi:signal peptidase II
VNANLILHQSIPVIRNIFHLTLIHNRGAAFGILKDQSYFFIFMSLLAVIFIYLRLRESQNEEKLLEFALIFILAGTVGNLIDRISFGYVIDFLDFRIWPVFNIADSSITVGAIVLFYTLLKKKNNSLA